MICYNYVVDSLSDVTVVIYDDDTTIACTEVNYDRVHSKLLNTSEILLDWFERSYLKANSAKLFGKR